MCVVVGFTSVASFFSVYISCFPAKHVSCPVGSYYIQVFSQKPVASWGEYNRWTGLLDWTTGLDYWIGLLDWTAGMDYWTGLLEWTTGLHYLRVGLVSLSTRACINRGPAPNVPTWVWSTMHDQVF